MKKAQKQVDDWVRQYKVEYFKPLEIMARLTEEVGELAREINHRYGPKKKKDTEDLKEETVDIIGAGLRELVFWVRLIISVGTILFLLYGGIRMILDKLGFWKIK